MGFYIRKNVSCTWFFLNVVLKRPIRKGFFSETEYKCIFGRINIIIGSQLELRRLGKS